MWCGVFSGRNHQSVKLVACISGFHGCWRVDF